MVGVDIKHLSIIATLSASLFASANVYAQDALRTTPSRTTASRTPAKSSERVAMPEGSAASYRASGSLGQAFVTSDLDIEACGQCRGWLVEAVLQWTDRIVAKLDPLGFVETPFEPAAGDSGGTQPSRTPRFGAMPRLRPVQLHGGYGLMARITF